MNFPISRTGGTMPPVAVRDLSALTRYVRWAYDGPPLTGVSPSRSALDDLAVWLVRSGEARITSAGQQAIVRAGQWVLPPTPSTLTQAFAPGTHLLSLRLVARWSEASPLLSFNQPIVIAADEHPALMREATRLVRATGSLPPPEATRLRDRVLPLEQSLRINSALETVLATLLPILASRGVVPQSPGMRMDPRVASAMTMLEAPGASPRSVARELGISISQLDRLFVAAIGLTPHALQQRRRLDFARQKLRQTDEPIKAIAYAARFRRVSHFSAWFSKLTGMSPRAYRRAADGLA